MPAQLSLHVKVTEYIAKRNGTLVSFEILPPLKGKSIQSIYDTLDPLMEFKPPFINVTYHRAEYMYKRNSEVLFEKVVIRKRPGTVGICAATFRIPRNRTEFHSD